MSKYGYVGKESDIPQQAFKANAGVLSVNDHLALSQEDKLTQYGQLELIETQTVSNVASVDFTNIDTSYNVHFLTINNLSTVTDNVYVRAKFYESGVLETASVYEYAQQVSGSNSIFFENKGTSSGSIQFQRGANLGNATNETGASYLYFYNLGDSSKYSFCTYQHLAQNNSNVMFMTFGSGLMTQASTVDGIQLLSSSGNINTGTFSLYGIKEYS